MQLNNISYYAQHSKSNFLEITQINLLNFYKNKNLNLFYFVVTKKF